jgi:hypothetical protein
MAKKKVAAKKTKTSTRKSHGVHNALYATQHDVIIIIGGGLVVLLLTFFLFFLQ